MGKALFAPEVQSWLTYSLTKTCMNNILPIMGAKTREVRLLCAFSAASTCNSFHKINTGGQVRVIHSVFTERLWCIRGNSVSQIHQLRAFSHCCFTVSIQYCLKKVKTTKSVYTVELSRYIYIYIYIQYYINIVK